MTIPRQVLLAMVAEAHRAWVLDHDGSTPFHPEHAVDVAASAQQLDDLHRHIEVAKAGWLATNP